MTRFKQALYLTLGIFFLLLGVIGLVLPILNGLILIVIGLILVSFTNPSVEYKLHNFAHRNEKVGIIYEKLFSFLSKLFRRVRN